MHLEFKFMDGKVIKAQVSKTEFTIGRSLKCDVVVPHEGLSRVHCHVTVEDDKIYLTDLDSANGVFISEVRIPPQTKTYYNPLFLLQFGSIEVSQVAASESFEEVVQEEEVISKVAPLQTRRGRPLRQEPKVSSFHPALKGVALVSALAIGYLFYIQIFDDSELSTNDITRMQYDNKMKNKANDGSVKTRNF